MKAEDRALKAYPIKIAERDGYDENLRERKGFVKGYHQAEKDLTDKAKLSSGCDGFYYGQGYKQADKDNELTWQDIELIINIDKDTNNEESIIGVRKNEEHYKEVLKRFKDFKERKQR
jgi:hypothetical protein